MNPLKEMAQNYLNGLISNDEFIQCICMYLETTEFSKEELFVFAELIAKLEGEH